MERALTALTECAAGEGGNLLELSVQVSPAPSVWVGVAYFYLCGCGCGLRVCVCVCVCVCLQASRARCTVGEISDALEKVLIHVLYSGTSDKGHSE